MPIPHMFVATQRFGSQWGRHVEKQSKNRPKHCVTASL